MATPKAKFRIEGEDATAAAFRSVIGNANKASAGIKSAMKFAFAGFSVSAIAGVSARAIEMGDELNKAAIKAGINGKAMSELAHAAKMADIELAGLSTGLKKMQVNLSEAAHGGKAQQQALADLGLTFKELQKLAPDRQFELIAERISQLEDPADRTRAAVDQFGKAGADLLPMFEKGAAGIRAARMEAEKLGKSFSDEQIKKLAEADDAIKRMTASWEGLATVVTAKVAPGLAFVFDLLSGNALDTKSTQARIRNLTTELAFFEENLRVFLKRNDEESVATISARIAKVRAELAGLYADMNAKNVLATGGPGIPKQGAGPDIAEARITARRVGVEAGAYDDIIADYEKRMGDATSDALRVALAEGAKGFENLADSMGKWQVPAADFIKGTNAALEKATEQMAELPDRAREFAISAHSDFEQFFFDPVHTGIKGLARDLLDSLRQSIAAAMADKLFGSKASGGMGLGGSLIDFGKSLFGFADGGSFKVGGSGGTDSQLVAFKASPDETVSINKPGQGGGIAVYLTQHVDARGADIGLTAALPRILKAHGQAVTSDIINGIRRGKYAV